MTDNELLRRCHTILPGHRARRPAEMFAAMAAWCEANDIDHDVYGEGALIEQFERKVAALLGFEAAAFCMTGTLAQATALRLACAERGSRVVALHPTAHQIVHERSNFQFLDHYIPVQAGDRDRPWTVADLEAIADRLGAVAIELPLREIGGQAPGWDELDAIKAHCRARGAHLHMDGARLLEAAAGYGKSPAQVAQGFDSAYLSLYKGVGGLGGAMLAGSREFVARAGHWFNRQGANLVHRSPYVVAAAMQFDQRVKAMPGYFARTEWLHEALRAHPEFKVNPARPQANMLHVHLPVGRERALAVRDALAREHGIRMFHRASSATLPDTSMFELYVGDNLLDMPDDDARRALRLFAAALA